MELLFQSGAALYNYNTLIYLHAVPHHVNKLHCLGYAETMFCQKELNKNK
jgi:hypothetical protein